MRCVIFALLLFITLGLVSFAENDWDQWRGPHRDGTVDDFVAPKEFPSELKKVWSVEVGIGHASPVVSSNKVFVFTRLGEQEVAAAYDLAGGKIIWKDTYDAPYEMNPAADRHGKGPKSTPLVANGKLFTFGISGILSCYDAGSGKLQWRNNFRDMFPVTYPDFGTAMSTMMEGGNLIVHAGGPAKGALLGLDPGTGKARWSWTGDGPAYASPIVADVAGTRQIVTQTEQNIVAVSASSGELLWKIPFTTEYTQNIITPVSYKDTLIFSGLNKGAFAVLAVRPSLCKSPYAISNMQ
jgi:outer membrane protein assembly factor BamB